MTGTMKFKQSSNPVLHWSVKDTHIHTHTDLSGCVLKQSPLSSLAMPTLAVTCAALPNPQNGEKTCVQPLGGSSYESTCWFTCHEGFSLSGPERLDCTPSGHWTGSPPTCEEGRTMGLSFLMASQVTV